MAFNVNSYINNVAKSLVANFNDNHADQNAKGSAHEKNVIEKMKLLLPNGCEIIQNGYVIDVNGNTSKEQDIIIYDRNAGFIFDNGCKYIPCELVIATGQIKTSLGKKELVNAFENILSVKKLKRYISETDSVANRYKQYLLETTIVTRKDKYDQNLPMDQVFSFILAGKLKITPDTVLQHFLSLVNDEEYQNMIPNYLLTCQDDEIYGVSNQQKRMPYMQENIIISKTNDNFAYLLCFIFDYINSGRTVRFPFDKYLFGNK